MATYPCSPLGACATLRLDFYNFTLSQGAGQYWYAYNLLSEISAPGEYSLNVTRQAFFAWLPDAAKTAPADAVVGAVSGSGNAITIEQAEYLIFDGLFIQVSYLCGCGRGPLSASTKMLTVYAQFAQGAGIATFNSSFIVVSNCTISGVGIMAANFTGGTNNSVRASSILDAGNGGINVYAGANL